MSDDPKDLLLVGPPTEGDGWKVLRHREDRLEVGELRPVREGRPLSGDLIKLRPRAEHDRLFDVEVLAELPKAPRAARSGPAQVATEAYREGWESIFGGGGEGGGGELN